MSADCATDDAGPGYDGGMRFVTWAMMSSVACAACGFRHGEAATGDGSSAHPNDSTARSDGPLPDAATCESIASLGVDLCPSGAPAAGIVIASDESLNTMDDTTTPMDSALGCAPIPGAMPSEVCVLYARSITIDAGVTLSAHGTKVLVLLATDSIDIEGSLDGGGGGGEGEGFVLVRSMTSLAGNANVSPGATAI